MPFKDMLKVSEEDRVTILTEALRDDFNKYLADYSPSMMALLYDWIDNQSDCPVKVNRSTHMAIRSLAMFLTALSPDDKNERKRYRKQAIHFFTEALDLHLMDERELTVDFVENSIEDGLMYMEGMSNDDLRLEMKELKNAIEGLRRRRDG